MITNSANKVIAAGNGSQTVFAFSFVGVAAVDIEAIYTDANGNETSLTQGPGSTQFQVSINAASPGQLWGLGGTVTYNPGGTPIATGTTLTIARIIAYTQGTSLQNQASFGQYAQATEQAMDLLEMQIQQIAEAQNRVISAPIVDPSTINLTLPPAKQRANNVLAFDGSGNVIAATTPATGLISSAMQPVVNAASLAAGRTAFGLGSMATLSPNFGFQEGVTGANLADVNFTISQDAGTETVTSAFHVTTRIASGGTTYNLPATSTLWNGFGFWVLALTGSVSFAPNAADNFAGMGSGVTFTVPVGTSLFVTTNGAGSWWALGISRVGINSPLNLQINASVSSNALTVALKDANGNDPSNTSPVILAFRDPTAANGDPQITAVRGALAITVPSGGTLGTANGAPFRVWVVAFNNAGTVVLGLFQSVSGGASPTAIAALLESAAQSPAGITSSSNSAGTFYAASTLSGVAVRILGYIDFEGGQATAGTWATAPGRIQLFGPGVRKPGDTIQEVVALISSTTALGTSNTQTAITASITPTSKINPIKVSCDASVTSASSNGPTLQLSRGTAPTLIGNKAVLGSSTISATINFTAPLHALDLPQTTSAQAYYVFGSTNTGSGSTTNNNGTSFIELKEIMA